MLRSFGKAVVESNYPFSALYQRGLPKVSTKRSCCYILVLLTLCLLLDSFLFFGWVNYMAFTALPAETTRYSHYANVAAYALDVARSVPELSIILHFEAVSGYIGPSAYDITISVNEAMPFTIMIPQHPIHLVTFVPEEEFTETLPKKQRQKTCSKYNSYVVAGHRSLLFCTFEGNTGYRTSKDSYQGHSWVLPLSGIAIDIKLDPITTIQLRDILAPLELLRSHVSTTNVLVVLGLFWAFYLGWSAFTMLYQMTCYFVFCFIISRLLKLGCRVGVPISYAVKLILHSMTPPLLVASLSTFPLMDTLYDSWLPWGYAFLVFLLLTSGLGAKIASHKKSK